MKRLLTTLGILAVAGGTALAYVYDDFDSGLSWPRHADFTWDPTGGIGGTGCVDVASTTTAGAWMIHPTGLSSAPSGYATASAWFKFGLNGTALNDTTGDNVDGTNDDVIMMHMSTTPDWWDGEDAGMGFARRADGTWGVKLAGDPWIGGWNDNTELGWADNSGSGTSGWFKMELVLSGGTTHYTQQVNVYGTDGTTLAYSTDAYPTSIPHGATIYAGFMVGGIEALHTLEQESKVNLLKIENFLFVIPEPSALAFLTLGLAGLLARRSR